MSLHPPDVSPYQKILLHAWKGLGRGDKPLPLTERQFQALFVHLEFTVNPLAFGGGWKPEYLEGTHTDMGQSFSSESLNVSTQAFHTAFMKHSSQLKLQQASQNVPDTKQLRGAAAGWRKSLVVYVGGTLSPGQAALSWRWSSASAQPSNQSGDANAA